MTVQISALGILLLALLYLPAWGQAQPAASLRKFDENHMDKSVVHWKDMPVRTEYGALQIRDMLTRAEQAGSSNVRGAVLTELKRVSYGFIAPGAVTDPVIISDEQHILYIAGGNGTISMGRQAGDLSEGVGVLVPPGLEFTISNTGNEPLTMYIIVEPIPAGFTPPRHLVIHNSYDNVISTNTNRTDSDQWLLSLYDGLSTAAGINPVVFEPRTLVAPHTHPPGTEEVWINLTGEMECYIGNQHRTMLPGTAYRPPTDSETPHVNLNATTTTKKLLWIMVVPREDVSGSPGPIM